METDGRDRGQNHDEEPSNVVRLPRDWLGPREELIPFGPSARQADGAAADVLELAPHHEGAGVTQHDFWGGAPEAIPRPVVWPPRAGDPSPPEVSVPVAARREPRSVGLGVGLARVGETVVRFTRARAMAVRFTRARAAAVAVVAFGAGAVGVALEASLGGRGAPRITATAHAGVLLDLPTTLDGHALKPAHPQMVRVRRSVRVRAARKIVRHAAAAATPTATFVKTYTPTRQTSSTTPSGATAVTRSTSAATRTTTHTSATTASSHQAKAGPVGRGAPFGPGQLG